MKLNHYRILIGFLALLTAQCSCEEIMFYLVSHPGGFEYNLDNGIVTPGADQTMAANSAAAAATYQATISTSTITVTQTTTQTMTQTMTATVVPSATQTVTATSTSTSTSAPPCLIPLAPPDGSTFDSFGKISFSWDSNIDAASYVVTVIAPNGIVMTFPAKTNNYSRWIESFPWGGKYSWLVWALDANGHEMCQSFPVTFKKPVTEPSLTPVPQGADPTPGGTPHTGP